MWRTDDHEGEVGAIFGDELVSLVGQAGRGDVSREVGMPGDRSLLCDSDTVADHFTVLWCPWIR